MSRTGNVAFLSHRKSKQLSAIALRILPRSL